MAKPNTFTGAGVDFTIHNGAEIQTRGFTVRAEIEHDDDATPPWEREDGHGPVTPWTTRAKAPGELVLNEGRRSKRFYDIAEATKTARREQWGAEGDEGMTPGQKAAHAARRDFERLRDWCNDRWSYVGVCVTVSRRGVTLTGRYDHALWGIESDAHAYLAEVADELTGPAIEAARAKLAELAAGAEDGEA
jgi:hypothetical protein